MFNLVRSLENRRLSGSRTCEFDLYRSQYAQDRTVNHGDLIGHKGCVNAINFNVAGDLIVTGSDDKTVKIWNTISRHCVTTLYGHQSNVFATNFLPHKNNSEIISAGNDADIRKYDIPHELCTIYQHHSRKILRLAVNPSHPDTFMSCSADGTIRLFDIRGNYANTRTTRFDKRCTVGTPCVPQALGGGRAHQTNTQEKFSQSLVLDYSKIGGRRRLGTPTLFSIDIHPNGHNFIVASELGDVRLFDLRKIVDNNPAQSTVNIYKNNKIKDCSCEVTGCVFSHDGREIATTHLCQYVYLFDTDGHYDTTATTTTTTTSGSTDGVSASPGSRRNRTTANSEAMQDGEPNQTVRIPVSALQQLFFSGTASEDSDMENGDNNDQSEDEGYHADESTTTEEEEEEEEDQNRSYKRMFTGHVSRETIKGVTFFGPRSEFIASGSDDGRVYIWRKDTGKLCNILEGHESTVNTVTPHPTVPLLATGGIDDYVKLWEPQGEMPTIEEREKQEKYRSRLQQKNKKKPIEREVNTRDMMYMVQVLRLIMANRGNFGFHNAEGDDVEM
jgi:WD40 repeat protein